jgi:hypothetical protein
MEFPEDIEKVGLGVSFRPAGVTKRKRETTKKAIESEESEWWKSDASLHERLVARDALVLPEPPSFELTILKKMRQSRTH